MGQEDIRIGGLAMFEGIEGVFLAVAVFLGFYIVGCAIRLGAGPTAPDRAVALDTINTLIVAAMFILGAAYREVLFIDISIVYALLSFITTLYIARYLEEKKPGMVNVEPVEHIAPGDVSGSEESATESGGVAEKGEKPSPPATGEGVVS